MKLFGKKKSEQLITPLNGVVKPLTDSVDPVFAGKMMGDGVLITPADGTVVAPCDGTITTVFPTKHAIGFQTENGKSILFHFGVDTVNLNGEGFEVFVETGQKVKANDLLWEADIEFIKANAVSDDLMIIFAEASENVQFEANYGESKRGDALLEIL